MLKNTNAKKGFTLVELLIVIVVIAILAAISIVAYNGIQNRGKASAAQSLASQVSKKAEAFNTIQSSYPTNVAAFATVDVSKLDNAGAVVDRAGTDPSDEKTVKYLRCTGGTGAQVAWYDAQNSTLKYMNMGTATGTTACAA